jgi:serine/threonine protein kinase/tetratricopeptide (TPR) repeat protein
MIGRTLRHYRVLDQIGAGGMGVVYRAHDEHLDRDVALKVLPPHTFDDEGARRRFRKEALALSKLNHPNIATVHDFDTQDGVDFLVVELIAGSSLDELLRHGALSEAEIIHFGQQLADGISAAHQAEVLHRDLKPANLRITPDRRLKILDFGLAKATQAATGSTEVKDSLAFAGTMPYMAPEQLSRGHSDARTDIWAIGAVLYEMATGRRPFQYPTVPRLTSAILTESPASPTSLNRDISAGLEQIILKCLDKDPENRYQSAREITVDLRRLTTATVPSIAPRPTRNRLVPVAMVAAIIIALTWGWIATRERPASPRAPAKIESLAVLPLANLSGQPEQEYFSDGMTDALITELAQIHELTVISRTSVLQYKGTRKPMPQIARELKVDAVVEGSVQRAGDRVGINVQLIHAPLDRHLWANNYQANLSDVLGLQREIARTIAGEIKAKLSPQEEARLGRRRQVDPAAYEAYLKGFHHARRITKDELDKGMEYFREALDRDPTFAPAYDGIAFVYAWRGDWYAPNREVLPKAIEASRKAIELDPLFADAHASLATFKVAHDHDWAGADAEFRKAIELNPGSAYAHRWYGILLTALGRFDDARREFERSLQIDPLSAEGRTLLANHFFLARQYDAAIQQLRQALELDPAYFYAEMFLGESYAMKGQNHEAIEAYKRAGVLTAAGGETPPDILGGLAYIHARAGNRAEANKAFAELQALQKRRYVAPFELAKFYLATGKHDEAVRLLEKSYEDRNWPILQIKFDARLDPLRSHPRFQALVARMRFPNHR